MNKLPETKNDFFARAFLLLFFIGVPLIISISGTNVDQEKYAREHKIDKMDYLKFTCQSKSICKNYAEIRLSCAEAGSIPKCIDIKMKGDDYSVCTDDGNISGLDEKLVPNFAQCFGSRVISFISRKG
ncbi:MAG: hypothetical protein KGL01_08645 [Betaproteobacteria bacterium]|nr:hypothetical protein [Betaproteobacteria bacterium]